MASDTLGEDEAFFAYLGGYPDAGGYVKTVYRAKDSPDLRVELRSYDQSVLSQRGEGLNARDIVRPPATLRVLAGYTNRDGVRSNKDL